MGAFFGTLYSVLRSLYCGMSGSQRNVKVTSHNECLRVGVGWFQPSAGNTEGRVSSPFPSLVRLMQQCSDDFFQPLVMHWIPERNPLTQQKQWNMSRRW